MPRDACRRALTVLTMSMLLAVAASAISASAASADTQIVGLAGWQVQSSARVPQGGARVSSAGFGTRSWLHVKPDSAGAVGTEVGALVRTGHCPSVFVSFRMKTCFGYMSRLGVDTIPRFAVPWWFRTKFVSRNGPGRHVQLIINGVVGEADVWLNGRRVATHAVVQGDFTRYTFDVTRLLRHGPNAIALEVYPNDPNTMFTLDSVDWMQIAPDNNTGVQFPIELHSSGPLAVSGVHVVEHLARDLSSATLTVKGVVSNETGRAQAGSIGVTVTRVGTREGAGAAVRLGFRATRRISIRMTLAHPDVWWPYGMGSQPLYGLRMSVLQRGRVVDSASETFGIRTITTRLIGPSLIAPHGSRQFLVNGRPFLFRAGGWSEDLFLRYSTQNTAEQFAMIQNLGLNGIRTEGKQMPQDFYEQADRDGILIDAGYQCCDAWQLQDSKLTSRHDYALLRNSAFTIGQNLRNHPSVLNFSWSDNNPTRRQEAVSRAGFRAADFPDPLIASAEYKSAPGLGPSGEKEGPYDWVPPSYWFDTTHYDPHDSTRTNVGGAWGFDSEASAGDTVPTLDSIRRFMSPFERRQLWKRPNYNQYHLNYEPGLPAPTNGGYSFGTLHDFDRALRARYGAWSSLDQFVEEAQVQNYETQRAEFEAYIDHSTRPAAPSTGIVYWQLNKGWPTLLWDLYNYDFDQAGSYFGAKKANEPLHASYAYDDGTVAVDNLGPTAQSGLSVESNVYALDGTLLDHQQRADIALNSQGVATGVLRPRVPATTSPPAHASTYFVELLLRRDGLIVDRNVYWLSTQPDDVNWSKTIGNPQASMTRYAHLTPLHQLRPASVQATASSRPVGRDTETDVTITNPSRGTVAFFLRADLRRGSASGAPARGDNEVLPISWSDNDITLWPGESATLRATYRRSRLGGAAPVVSLFGWNVATESVPAGP